MSAKIMYYPNGAWIGGGCIPGSLRDISNLAQWMTNFLRQFETIGKSYCQRMKQPLSFSNEVNGQAKINLLSELDDLIGALIVFRRYLTKNSPDHFYSLKGPYAYSFYIHVDKVSWGGKGRLAKKYTFNMSTFADWYNDIMLKNISKVFDKYQKILIEGLLTEKERNGLICFIETAIFDILVIKRIVISFVVNS
jgi:hypothetical protein